LDTGAVGAYQVVVKFTPVEMRVDAYEPGRVVIASAVEDVNMAVTEPRGGDRCQLINRQHPSPGPVASPP
jgi:hypothetical protein